jgi:Uma2 family endonuclease
MAFTIDDTMLPARLTSHLMTDEEFAELCAEHPDLFLEMTAAGELIVMPATHSLTGVRNSRILRRLDEWAERDSRGLVTDAATGFVLPNGARRSPDAAWTAKARILQLSKKSQEGFWHLAPDFLIELKSDTDRLPVVRDQMREWIANGSQLGWLINPDDRSVEVYRPDRDPELRTSVESIEGEGPVEGFTPDLRPVWDPLATS